MRAISVLFLGLSLGLSGPALAQSAPLPFARLELHSFDPANRTARVSLSAGERMGGAAEGKDHTTTGILVGAGLGLAAGWLMYDALCEAVNNDCTDSRARLVLTSGFVGSAIGGLIGSLSN